MTAAPFDERNWSGNYRYRARALHRPTSQDELRRLVAAASNVRALGSRHSFTGIGDAEELIALDRLPGEIVADREAMTVAVPASTTYAQLAETLSTQRLALANMASLPHISVAGAVATATHGSGERLGNLATSVVELELITASGDLLTVGRDHDRFDGFVVGVGALGIVTRVTLAVQPYYEVAQMVYERLPWDALYEHLDDVYAAGDSVSVFHRLGDQTEQIWVKRRAPIDDLPAQLFGALPADAPRNPLADADPANATAQLGELGPWSERLPHFRSGFTPSSGEEIQSEAFVARADALEAISAVRELSEQIRPWLLVSELRAIAGDDLWLSPQYGRDTLALHFTWRREQTDVERAVERIESALAGLAVRSHWGKVTSLRSRDAEREYERLEDFRRLRDELDPRGTFVNDWMRAHVL